MHLLALMPISCTTMIRATTSRSRRRAHAVGLALGIARIVLAAVLLAGGAVHADTPSSAIPGSSSSLPSTPAPGSGAILDGVIGGSTDTPSCAAPAGDPCDASGPASIGTGASIDLGAGNPIHLASGNKYRREIDLPALPGVSGLEIVRHYNSTLAGPDRPLGILGRGWRLSYETELAVFERAIHILQADGSRVFFARNGTNTLLASDPAHGRLKLIDTPERPRTFHWQWPDGRRLDFDARGRLTQILLPDGHFVSLARAPDGTLLRVTDPQGRSLIFEYAQGTTSGFRGVVAIVSPLGRFTLAHQNERDKPGFANLLALTDPTGATRRYHYGADEGEAAPSLPHHLTGISVEDEGKTLRIASYGYDARGRATRSVRGRPRASDAAGRILPGTGIEQVDVEYPAAGVTVLTNSLGQRTRYRHTVINAGFRLLEAIGPGCARCGPTNRRYSYDKRGRLVEALELDTAGTPIVATRFEHDHLGRIRQRSAHTSRGGELESRLIARYEYEGDDPRPVLIARPSVVPGREHRLRIRYNEHGQPLQITESGFSALDASGDPVTPSTAARALERTTTYTYVRINGRSLLAEIDGPLANGPANTPHDSDLTRYARDAGSGRVEAVTHPMGLTETFEYDPNGRLRHHRAIDQRSTRILHARSGRVIEIDRDGAVTRHHLDATGALTRIEDANGQQLDLVRDPAGRLERLRDAADNRIVLTRSTEGLPETASLLTPDHDSPAERTLHQASAPDVDHEPNRDAVLAGLHGLIASAQRATNPARPDPLPDPYFILRNFIALTAPGTPAPKAVAAAKDSQGRTTTYHRNDFGWLEQVNSPVSGRTSYQYDASGRIVARLQHDGSRATYQRDAAGRVVALRSHDASGQVDEDARIAWGPANKPSRIRYLAGEEHFHYDTAARLTEHTQIVDGHRQSMRYRYDRSGRMLARTLPGGQVLDYRYHAPGHAKPGLLASIWLRGALAVTSRPVIQDLNDAHEGVRRRGFSYGNGLTHQHDRDAAGRSIRAGNPQVGQTQLRYPPLPTAAAGPTGHRIEVRTQHPILLNQRARAEAALNAYSRMRALVFARRATPSSTSVAPRPIYGIRQDLWNIGFDALGRQTRLGPARFEYDSLSRLVAVKQYTPAGEETVATYRYNLFGQRIAKTLTQSDGRSTRTTHYFYDGSQLVAESDAAGHLQGQYLWLNDKPIGMLRNEHLYAVHTDHRNAPLAVTDEARRVVWQAQVADFLRATPVRGQALGLIDFNLRGSNQYFDIETGLHYNTHRYYDPIVASYLTPDPLGLAAGPDLYAFALEQPHRFSDPLGLAPVPTQAVADWPLAKRLEYSLDHAATQFSSELGDALRELASPEALATTATIFGIWGAAQFTPYGWAADLALTGIGYLFLGTAVWDVIKGVHGTLELLLAARCENDLKAAGDAFATALATATANLGATGAAAGTPQIARLLRRIFKDGAPDTGKNSAVAAISEKWFGTFTPGRTRSGADENAEYLARRGPDAYAPWLATKPVKDTWLNPGEKIYIIEERNALNPGGWATNKRYASIEQARNELSLLQQFKSGDLVMREYTVQAPIPVRAGHAGGLTSVKNPNESYPGGGFQWEILFDTRNNSWNEYLKNRTTHEISQ